MLARLALGGLGKRGSYEVVGGGRAGAVFRLPCDKLFFASCSPRRIEEVGARSLCWSCSYIKRPLHTRSAALGALSVPYLCPETGGKVQPWDNPNPEEFFHVPVPKTESAGPYVLGTGLLLYLLSKEIYVINHETIAAISIVGILIYGIKKFGGDVAAFADKLNNEKVASLTAIKDSMISSLETAIADEKKEQWRVEGRHYLFDAKRNNIAMLLETNYRERLLSVFTEVKKRLDYQVAMQHFVRQKEQDHMIKWVEQNVRKSITAQQEKESIAKCISDLKVLSKSAQAAV
uniref:Uncharacterized protein n=1 Tax=Sphaerodactylus townsendi TaxID=933632 RepID=A0ACB8F5H9_9SAUR